ncbi:CKLF-like MARVEL transmembrane domain-containing protein 6 [Astyanax mexicanus]|uniref:CKLF-like MARVEL transmembrane domain-containing protein 6 n=1 Tax=Astyanax mexicanus TaxID=7994 RepID=UPI0020CAC1BF|nr:CKLF-like MARVEL transmembrane domain-containing protein 6 [Astyanax mexicanus]
MENPEVYSPTTTAQQPTKDRCFMVPSKHLDSKRFFLKALEVLLSFVAFVLEEVVSNCTSCAPLYFFEFVSCTAFLFTLLLLILLVTPLYLRVGITCWPLLDFVYTLVIAVFFAIASIVFAADNGDMTTEKAAVVFGFVATVVFFIDLGLFVMNQGIPCLKRSPAADNTPVPVAEAEKLNANGNE